MAEQDNELYDRTGLAPRILRNIHVWSIYLIAFLAPLFYLTITADPLFGKQVLVMILTAVAFLAWLVRILITKEIRFHYSVVIAALGVFLAILFFSAFFSLSPATSFFASDSMGERFASFVTFALIAFLVSSEFSRKEVLRLAHVILTSGFILALFIFFRVTSFFKLPNFLQVNPIGNLNNSAAVLIVFLLFGLGFVICESDSRYRKIFSWLLLLFSALDLLVIDFKIGWIALAVFSAILTAFYSSQTLRTYGDEARRSRFVPANLIFLIILGLSISFALFNIPVGRVLHGAPPEIEVTPSIQSTLSIGGEVLKTRPIFGSGPGTFIYDYSRFRSPVINQTIFWNVKFVHGFSFLLTLISTLGVLGIFAALFLLFGILYALVKITLRMERSGAIEMGLLSIALFGVVLWVMYPPTFVMNVLIFLALGSFLAVAPGVIKDGGFFWFIGPLKINIEHQAAAFVASLFVLAAIIFTLLGGLYITEKYIAEVYFTKGVYEFTQNGNADIALARFSSALSLDPNNDRYFVNQSQVYFVQAQQAISKALAGDAAAQNTFRSSLNAALDAGRRAVQFDQYDSDNWLNLGTIYETAVPFVDGADQLAVSSYQQAIQYDPINPTAPTLLGRTYLEIADLIDLRARQNPASASTAPQLKKTALENAKTNLEKAADLKSDLATTQFLLAQTFTREGDIDEAIRRGVQTALIAPNDVGVAFFLGFLFYQKNDLVDAEQQFSRAIEINPNYSNALYFLGLIYDKTQRSGEALKQFQRIAELNPDNDEIKKIIVNLKAGRPALATITPPPEKRKTPPIQDTTTQKLRQGQTRRK